MLFKCEILDKEMGRIEDQ